MNRTAKIALGTASALIVFVVGAGTIGPMINGQSTYSPTVVLAPTPSPTPQPTPITEEVAAAPIAQPVATPAPVRSSAPLPVFHDVNLSAPVYYATAPTPVPTPYIQCHHVLDMTYMDCN